MTECVVLKHMIEHISMCLEVMEGKEAKETWLKYIEPCEILYKQKICVEIMESKRIVEQTKTMIKRELKTTPFGNKNFWSSFTEHINERNKTLKYNQKLLHFREALEENTNKKRKLQE